MVRRRYFDFWKQCECRLDNTREEARLQLQQIEEPLNDEDPVAFTDCIRKNYVPTDADRKVVSNLLARWER